MFVIDTNQTEIKFSVAKRNFQICLKNTASALYLHTDFSCLDKNIEVLSKTM